MKVNRNRRKTKQNNQGFSLIELIIAVTILAIIVVPLSRSFVTAARTNFKSKQSMEATTAGQNLIEILKTEDIKEFSKDTVSATAIAGVTDPEGNPYYIYEKHYDSSNMVGLAINNHEYEAKVTIDPTAYLDAVGLGEDALKASSKYNSIPMAQLANMNTATSAFYVMERGDDLRGLISLDMDAYDSEDDAVKAEYIQKFKREITLKITYDDSSHETVVLCTLKYIDGRDESNVYTAYVEHEIYRNSLLADGTRPQLTNLFVCYVPLFYTTEQASTQKETIIIENEKRLPVRTYLVKQDLDIAGKDFSSYKSTYQMDAKVKESQVADPNGKAGISLMTNMNYSKAENRILLTYMNGPVIESNPDKILCLKDGSLVDEKSSTVIYDIKVEVYKNGEMAKGGEPLVVLTGTTAK